MTKKMLIDATHSEEMSNRKQIKGNIYLGKIMRVEPSLQACFVDYGGNRHGFLAFNEIHPDYYQIPVADREALKEALLQEENEEEDEEKAHNKPQRKRKQKTDDNENQPLSADTPEVQEDPAEEEAPEQIVETVSEDENDEVMDRSRYSQIKKYKIQEVIHRGQVLLVQVTKEERGNKGAALTTYLSLAGRYCVLMPNNARGGGVSRKITNAADRKRLKTIISKLPLPAGMSVIVRTAGKERTSLEIKRDYEYLIKTWVQVRDKTMQSSAPELIHEEGNLIKRALRDMYTRDISEVLIEGEAEYRMAKDFMKILTPSHAKKIKQYKDETMPLFFRYQVESQLESMHSNIVQLKSGAYLVMDQTEALVAIDVNSGRATKERNIEETALKTNLEAADEIARQLRLRDMAGLVVIDFIDMEEPRNNHAVERRMKEALKRDRARVQMGRITGFGLMELSRQRLHSSFIEASYLPCPHCKGKGVVRSTESVSIHTLHILEEESLKRRFSELRMTVPTSTALYVLNNKREDLHKIETKYDVKIFLEADDSLLFPTDYRIERVVRIEADPVAVSGAQQDDAEPQEEEQTVSVRERPPRERRRRHRRNKNEQNQVRQENQEQPTTEAAPDSRDVREEQAEPEINEIEVIQADAVFEEGLKSSQKAETTENHQEEKNNDKKHRRGHFLRRGRRFHSARRRNENEAEQKSSENEAQDPILLPAPQPQQALPAPEKEEKPAKKPRRRYSGRRRKTPAPDTAAE